MDLVMSQVYNIKYWKFKVKCEFAQIPVNLGSMWRRKQMRIRLDHITKVFKTTVAVDDISFTIEDGEMICLLGPSGCGKSTTLSMVAGLEQPTSGEIYFDDQPMSGVEAEDRDIGMVFQNYALYPICPFRITSCSL